MSASRESVRIPDFFIVGQHKSGTTALYRMLRSHPQIYMPKLKEPRYFASDLRDLTGPNGRLPQTWEQYVALFAEARPDQRAGEASPNYLRSSVAAQKIAEVRPDARIIAILREPASFVRSLQLQLLQDHVEHEQDLGRAFAAENIVRAGRSVQRYSDHLHYVEQLRRYDALFPPEQMCVLIYDDFRADNEATLRRVLRFLGVDDSLPIELSEANPTVRVRSLRLDSKVRSLYAGRNPFARALKSAATRLTGRATRERLRRKLVYGRPPEPDEAVMLELRRRFKPEVEALSRYLSRDLVALWGYEDVG